MDRHNPDEATWALIAGLFQRHVPEVAAGVVEIRAVARFAGSHTKIALESRDKQVDCVRVCVGDGSRRISAIVAELGETEKVDLIPWTASPARLVRLALAPGSVEDVRLDLETKTAVAVVLPDQAGAVLGPGGENRELASRLVGWQIEIQLAEDAT